MAFTVALTADPTRPLAKKLQAELPECQIVSAPVTSSRPVSDPQVSSYLNSLRRGEYSWVVITSARTVKYLQKLLAAASYYLSPGSGGRESQRTGRK